MYARRQLQALVRRPSTRRCTRRWIGARPSVDEDETATFDHSNRVDVTGLDAFQGFPLRRALATVDEDTEALPPRVFIAILLVKSPGLGSSDLCVRAGESECQCRHD